MKNIIFRNGLWASIFLIVISVVPLLFLGLPGADDFANGEIIGYISILLSMVFVYLGMKQYSADSEGEIGYWQATKVGVLITIFPAVAFGLYNLIYTTMIDPEFFSKYAEYMLSDMSVGKSAEEIAELRQSINAEMEQFQSPIIQFATMFFSVFLVGAIVSLISGFVVKRS